MIEKDLTIHGILKVLCNSRHFAENYLFKGGSCLVKCYFGYYRFSVDLDFTWQDQKAWVNLGKYELRRRLLSEIGSLGSLLENIAQEMKLDFKNDLKNTRYFAFGGGCKMVTYKLWRNLEFTKIHVRISSTEILFPSKIVIVKTLLDNVQLSKDDRAYFEEALSSYQKFTVQAYSEKEILCEKVRAVLTRRAQKLRDFYDLYMLEKSGVKMEEHKEQIVAKINTCLNYKRYRASLERNIKSFELSSVLEEPFERGLFVVQPPKDFDLFLKHASESLTDPSMLKHLNRTFGS